MAIGFFKREEPQARFLAVEKLNLAYNLFTTVLIIIFFNRLNDPQAQLMGRFFHRLRDICSNIHIHKVPFACNGAVADCVANGPAELLVSRHF